MCEDRRSVGGRRSQHRSCSLAGQVRVLDGPHRAAVRAGGTAAPGAGVRPWPVVGPAARELLDARRVRWQRDPDGLQHLLSRARWDADAVRDDLRGFVVGNCRTVKRCWSSMRPAISRRAPPRSGFSASPRHRRTHPLTCNEIQHLFTTLVTQLIHTAAHPLRWSDWRRRHQARARACHYQRQATHHQP